MGIFSSKKVDVDTTIVRVVDDTQVPDARISALIEGVMKSQGVSEVLMDNAINGSYRNFERMYRWAKDNYVYGLPNTKLLSNNDGYDLVVSTLTTLAGAAVTIDYLHFRPPNNVHIGWKEITDNYGYDHTTNELATLSAQKGFTVYLDDIVAVHRIEDPDEPDRGTLGAFGNSPSAGYAPEREAQAVALGLNSLVVDQTWQEGAGLTESVEIHYLWRDEVGDLQQESITISLAGYELDEEYYQVKYHYTLASVEYVAYWTYNPNDGSYPALDNVYALNFTTPGTYFPFTIFRREGISYTAGSAPFTEEYASTEEMLDKINVDFGALGEQIDATPDINDIEQAAMIMAVPINSDNESEIKYLYRFFENLYTQQGPIAPPSVKQQSSLNRTENNAYAVQISDADFRIVISYSNITMQYKTGSIGSIGSYTNTFEALAADGPAVNGISRPATTQKKRYLRYQVSVGVYIELAITDPKTRYDIYRGKGTVGSGDDGKLLIPLDYTITSTMPVLDREQLYFRSLHLVFNSLIITKTSFFSSSVFRIVLVIVAVVITIATGGATWQALVAAFEAGTLAYTLLVMFVKALVVQMVIKVAARVLGPELSLILAVVAAVYGGVKAYNAGGVSQSTWAQNLLKVSTSLSSAASEGYSALMDTYQGDLQAFNLLAEQKFAELEDVNNLLESNILDPFAFIGEEPLSVAGESPDNYFTRTIHAGNIGTLSYDFIENFVDTSLTLPTIDDTLGDKFYV